MELEREHFRAMILYDFKCSLNESQTLERLTQTFGDLAPSRATVFCWFAEFKRGRISLKDEERSGRPTSVMTEENISTVEALIKEDPRHTYKGIEGALGISSPSVSTILHQHLRVRKNSSRWVPHLLSDGLKCTRVEWCTEMLKRFNNGDSHRVSYIVTGEETWIYQFDLETKRQSSVWVFPDEQPPTKVKRQRNAGKKMVATFFSKSGHVATVVLEDQRTVTAK